MTLEWLQPARIRLGLVLCQQPAHLLFLSRLIFNDDLEDRQLLFTSFLQFALPIKQRGK